MKLFTYEQNGAARVAAGLDGGELLDLQTAHVHVFSYASEHFKSMVSLAAAKNEALVTADLLMHRCPPEAVVRFADVRLLAPVPRPPKIRDFSCFEKHLRQAMKGAVRPGAKATGQVASPLPDIPGPGWFERPVYYYCDATTVIGPDESVNWPQYSNWIDFEIEIGTVIGPAGKDVSRASAMDHVLGYTIFNDLSARDEQFKAMSSGLGAAKGKDFDGSNVLGPCIVTVDEIPDPYALTMRVRVNGEQWSVGDSTRPQWHIADCIAYAAQCETIHPGEVFGSGTVGDGSGIELGREVQRGDIIEIEIEKIGILRTSII